MSEQDKYPSVTEIIYTVMPIEFEVDNYYMTKGKAIHRAIELLLQDNLDEDTVQPDFKIYIDIFKEFIKAERIEPLTLEKRFYNDRLLYSGKPDIICNIDGTPCIIDIKTSKTESKQWRLQLAAYSDLTGIKKRMVVYWGEDKWKKKEYTDKTDIYVFYSCLTVYNFLKKG
jgi:hypothetical protein